MNQADWTEELEAQLAAHPNIPVYICLNKGMGADEQELEIQEVCFECRGGIDVIVIEVSGK